MTIRVLSIDFDGCVSNEECLKTKDILASNRLFLNKINEEKKAYKATYVVPGTNRQSYYYDWWNGRNGSGSCYSAFSQIADHLGAILDKFLLADIYADQESGSSFDKAVKVGIENGWTEAPNHANWKFDESKGSIIYAQVHRFANLHPNEEIVFDFYDDRGLNYRTSPNLLEPLRDFFKKYPDLLPDNVTLRLNHYAGGDVTSIAEIKGTGFIDKNYKQTVKDMGQQAQTKDRYGMDAEKIFVTQVVSSSSLKNRIPLKVQTKSETPKAKVASTLIPDKAKAPLELILDKAEEMVRLAPSQVNSTTYLKAAQAVIVLHRTLKTATDNYSNDKNAKQFMLAANGAIIEANRVIESYNLQNLPAWKEVLKHALTVLENTCEKKVENSVKPTTNLETKKDTVIPENKEHEPKGVTPKEFDAYLQRQLAKGLSIKDRKAAYIKLVTENMAETSSQFKKSFALYLLNEPEHFLKTERHFFRWNDYSNQTYSMHQVTAALLKGNAKPVLNNNAVQIEDHELSRHAAEVFA